MGRVCGLGLPPLSVEAACCWLPQTLNRVVTEGNHAGLGFRIPDFQVHGSTQVISVVSRTLEMFGTYTISGGSYSGLLKAIL